MDWAAHFWTQLNATFGVRFFLSPLYISATVVIAYLIWRFGREQQSFLQFLLPRKP